MCTAGMIVETVTLLAQLEINLIKKVHQLNRTLANATRR